MIIAHRGGYKDSKTEENSWDAFKALEDLETVDVSEADVRRCPFHGNLVLSHDPVISKEQCERVLEFKDFLPFGKWMTLHVELKEKGLVKEAVEMVRALRHKDSVVYSSFLWRELFKVRRRDKRVRLGLLWSLNRKLPFWVVALVGQILGAESIHVNFNVLNKKNVEYFRRKGFSVYAYTVNSNDDIINAYFLGLDGIFTDYPIKALNLISKIIIQ